MSGSEEAGTTVMVVETGTRDLRRARRLLVLTPVGLVVGFLFVMAIASSMGIGVVSVVMEGPPATAMQTVFLIVAGEVAVLALPVAAGMYSLRAHRAGHPKARSTMAAAGVFAVVAAVLPVVAGPRSPTPSDDAWKSWGVVDLSGLPSGAYQQGQTWPETRSSGVVIAVHTQWVTERPPRQACTDFTQALKASYPDATAGQVDDLGCLVRADGERVVVEIHGGSFGSGAVADVIQQYMGG